MMVCFLIVSIFIDSLQDNGPPPDPPSNLRDPERDGDPRSPQDWRGGYKQRLDFSLIRLMLPLF